MLLLRKANLHEDTSFTVLPSCITRYREYFDILEEDGVDPYIEKKIQESVEKAARNGHIFENPRKRGQYVAYAKAGYTDVWYVIASNRRRRRTEEEREHTGSHVIVTMLIHDEKHFADERAEVRCG